MKKIQTPRFLSNLYRDMRDRRMLIPAIALVVALIAVPVLLTKSSASAPPPAPTAAGGPGGEGSATEPAVVTEQLGVTDYRKRLDQLNSKDPFRRHFTTLPKSAKLTTTSPPSVTSSSTAGTSSTSGLSTSATSSGSVSGSSTGSPSTATTTSSGSGSSNSNSSTSPSSLTLYSFRVSVAVGPAGDLTNRDNVKRTAYLPGKNRPLVSYVGVAEDTKHAIFSVSRDVSSVRGDGRCYPRRGNCNFLRLKAGDKAGLDYAPEGDRTYNLKLREIKLVPTSTHHKGGSNKIASQPLLGPDG